MDGGTGKYNGVKGNNSFSAFGIGRPAIRKRALGLDVSTDRGPLRLSYEHGIEPL